MDKIIDYYFSPMSPWTYLGHERFIGIAKKHGARIEVKPVDYGKIFPVSGGLPLAKRAPQRQKYRLVELQRWRRHLGVPLVLQPKYFPYDTGLASRMIIAARALGQDSALKLAGEVLKGCWTQQRNMADEPELKAAAESIGLDGDALLAKAKGPETQSEYDRLTEEAIGRDVFGAPTYVFHGELFWGQDRLDFLDRALGEDLREGL
ncbi:MAG TPA: 2-hydroxychromene-2-carboxylate isomerase [Burkholderiales bacterium]|jgi:2-hydroxychromene-2-carboxylate isomerase|nr:2-hydroxychromene-2-carboxylate isomerase [Burkholderiales bacterium]